MSRLLTHPLTFLRYFFSNGTQNTHLPSITLKVIGQNLKRRVPSPDVPTAAAHHASSKARYDIRGSVGRAAQHRLGSYPRPDASLAPNFCNWRGQAPPRGRGQFPSFLVYLSYSYTPSLRCVAVSCSFVKIQSRVICVYCQAS